MGHNPIVWKGGGTHHEVEVRVVEGVVVALGAARHVEALRERHATLPVGVLPCHVVVAVRHEVGPGDGGCVRQMGMGMGMVLRTFSLLERT